MNQDLWLLLSDTDVFTVVLQAAPFINPNDLMYGNIVDSTATTQRASTLFPISSSLFYPPPSSPFYLSSPLPFFPLFPLPPFLISRGEVAMSQMHASMRLPAENAKHEDFSQQR